MTIDSFPPKKDDLLHEDVKALFRLAGVSWTWRSEYLAFRLLLHDDQYYADMLVDADQLQSMELAQHFVWLMVTNLERMADAR